MKKLLLIVTILISANSLRSMEKEVSTLPTITLPQIYSHLAKILPPEIVFHVFSLQPGTNILGTLFLNPKEINCCSVIMLRTFVEMTLYYSSRWFTVELLKQRLIRENVSICDVIKENNETVLHLIASGKGLFNENRTETAKIFLENAGNETLKLLTMQTLSDKETALHIAAKNKYTELVTLFLNAAGNHVQDFINIPDKDGKTAFDIATPEVKEIMLPYLKK